MAKLDYLKETAIPAAYIHIRGDRNIEYLVTSGPITYIMQKTRYENGSIGWKDATKIPDANMQIIRETVKRLWDVLI